MTKKFNPAKSPTAKRAFTREEIQNNPFFSIGVAQGVILALKHAEEKQCKLEDLALMYKEQFGDHEGITFHLPKE